jgi:hypothetical protein
VYPPVAIDLGEDTICATVTIPCSTAAASLVTWLGISGQVNVKCVRRAGARAGCAGRGRWLRGAAAPRVARHAALTRTRGLRSAGRGATPHSTNINGCQANAQVTIQTAFTADECADFVTQYNALDTATADPYVMPVLCATNDCNTVVSHYMASAAPSAGAAAGAVGATAAAAALAAALL